MKKPKTQPGLSLVEVVAAIAIASFLLTSFVMLLSAQYSSLNRIKFVTSDYFMAQKNVENMADELRVAFKVSETDGTPLVLPADTAFTTTTKTPLTVFSGSGSLPWGGTSGIRLNNVYTVQSTLNGAANTLNRPAMTDTAMRKLFVLVTDRNIPELPACQITDMEVELLQGDVPIFTHYAHSPDPLSIKLKDASLRYDAPMGAVLQQVNYYWYMSEVGFNTAAYQKLSTLPTDRERSLYPLYKSNFEILRGTAGTTLTVTPDMAGRVVALVGAPASTNGKIGKDFVSDYIYLMGLPVLDGSILHMDAGIVAPGTDTDLDPVTNESLMVTRWQDCDPNHSEVFTPDDILAAPRHNVVNTGVIESISTTLPGSAISRRPVMARAINFDGARSMSSRGDINTGGEFTLFVVAQSADKEADDSILEWGDLTMTFEGFGTDEDYPTPPDLNGYSMLGCLQSSGIDPDAPEAGFFTFVNKETPAQYATAFAPSGTMVLAPADDNIQIVEIIAYDRALTEDELQDVRDYLLEKYGLDS